MSLSMTLAAAKLARETRRAQRSSSPAKPHTNPEPPHTLRQHQSVSTREVCGFPVYSVAPLAFALNAGTNLAPLGELAPNQTAARACLYLHAGGFSNTIRPPAWNFIDQIADSGVRVEVPIYGLVPEHSAPEATALVQQTYRELVADHGEENVSILGESAGGALAVGALLFGIHATPAHLILNAPWLDLELGNPRMSRYEQRDPKLSSAGLRPAGRQWAGGDPAAFADPTINPAAGWKKGAGMASLITQEQQRKTTVTAFCGDRDLSLPDTQDFTAATRRAGLAAELVEVPGGFHMYHLSATAESRRDRRRIVDLINQR
ncbi:alpha/beta hydrolase fold domain-containing protein [Corynebacterium heidelbergense]|uniref:Alpha/beta hydrolase fold-3 domain-containing protein n=1 Tax=Corynebacterium heidelbergense TaxID=2055947 RepID=A0A364V522_9CORY|nr:alpha/beta hydrolase [Corynebacterium heidelbergense]RAV31745.1 hypothetical protein DLJ54_06750 [Corynebacterium heidelbergense]